jgi:inner membrane protein
VMAFLTIALIVPVTWIYTIAGERAARRDQAAADISATWGGPQTIGGPVLSIPYSHTVTDQAGRQEQVTMYAHLLPRDLQIDTTVDTERRRRGIFDVVVYRAQVTVRGRFRSGGLTWARPAAERVDWSGAILSVGISDARGLARRGAVTWNGREVPFSGGVAPVGLFSSGVQAAVGDLTPQVDGEVPFSLTLTVNGSRNVRFMPSAEETTVNVQSPWLHPSFAGGALPDRWDHTGAGFVARWQVPDFGRPYPGRWTSADVKGQPLSERAQAAAFGVDFIQPVDIYQKTERAVKYAVLFFAFTFVVFFLWEVFRTTLMHPVQYTFVGFALCVFYLLLLSISEHVGFDIAYAISAITITLLIGGYARATLHGTARAGSVVASLGGMYGLLFLLLRLEDYALLAGSLGLLIVLAILMFVTRRMNWYDLRLGTSES